MKNVYDELWKLPDDTLSLASDANVKAVQDDNVTEEMNYLSNDKEHINYSEIKYEELSDISKVINSNIDYKRYELSESDRVLKDNVRYISLKYICRYLNRTVEWIDDRQILHNMFYMVDSNGDKLYREDEIVARMRLLDIEFRRTDLPFSEFNRTEAAEYMGISQEDFEKIAPEIKCKEETTESGEKYSIFYRKDLDKAYRHHYFVNIIANSNGTISPVDICRMLDIHGADYERFKTKYPMALRKGFDTKSTMRYCANDVKCYVNEHSGDRSIYHETPQLISAEMARIYINANRKEWLDAIYTNKVLKPAHDSNGKIIKLSYMNLYNIDDLDWYIDERECHKIYGMGREFITRTHIKNRYGVNDKWIDTFVKNSEKIRIKLCTNEVMTWEYYSKIGSKLIIIGINYSDVESLIKDGHFIDVTREYVIKKLGIDKEENKKRFKKGKYAILASHMAYIKSKVQSPYVYNKVDMDSIALSIESKINEERLILDEKKRVLQKISRDRQENDNKMREILGLTKKSIYGISDNICIKDMDTPQIFMCVNKRGDCTLNKNFKLPFLTYNFQYSLSKYFTKNGKQKQSVSMKAFCSGMYHMVMQKFRVTPSWFVFMESTSYITDIFFKDKLMNLPPDVGVVGVYGRNNIPKSYNWRESNDTVGSYDTYSIKDKTTHRVVGNEQVDTYSYVDIVEGPVFAVRGSLILELLQRKYLHGYRVGDDHIGAVLSVYANMCRRKVCVLNTSCTSCSDYDAYIGGDEWQDDQIQFVMSWSNQLKKMTRSV